MHASVQNEIQRQYHIRFVEIIISVIFGVIALGIFLVVPISAILLGKNIQDLNDVNLNMVQGFNQARRAISLLNQAQNNMVRFIDVGIGTLIPFVAIYLIIRIMANGMLFSNEYHYHHRINQNPQLFKVCIAKRIVNVVLILIVLVSWIWLLIKFKNEFYQPTHVVLDEISAVFTYIKSNNGSVDNMRLEWYNDHAQEMQQLFINIANTYKVQAGIVNTTLNAPGTTTTYIVLMVCCGGGLLAWLISASVFGAVTKSIIIGKEPEEVVWLVNNKKILLEKKAKVANATSQT